MIISASYKTDIPAFYGEWFINRLNAGYCRVVNPYNQRAYRVSLERAAVDGFVFWTKNLGPFMSRLAIVRDRGYPFVVQYTINAYPRTLERSVVNARRSVEHMRTIAGSYGLRAAVWRYDTVVFTSVTTADFHRHNFESLAQALEGTTDEVVISFAQIYKKTLQNMNWAAREFGFTWEDPADELKLGLAAELAQMAKSHGMQLTMCSQRQYLAPGVKDARCVDVERLSEIAGRRIVAELKGNRMDCGCYVSRDIGEYDTCPHGCVYCYAVSDTERTKQRFKEHSPFAEFLFRNPGTAECPDRNPNDPQMSLF